MGLRSQKRHIAKARMAVIGLGNINRKFSLAGSDGVKNWKKALFGESGKKAHEAQMRDGQRRKQAAEAKKSIARRKLKKVTA